MKKILPPLKAGARDGPVGLQWLLPLSLVFVLVAMLAVVLAFVGLLDLRARAHPEWDFWDLGYGVVQVFSSSSPSWEVPGLHLPLTYRMAKFMGPVSTGYAFLSTAAVLLTDRWRLLRARLARGQAIVCGGNRGGISLARALARAGTVVLVDQHASSERMATSLVRKVVPISGDPRDLVVLRRAGVHRAHEIFAIDEVADVNAAVAVAANASASTRSQPLTCYALIDDADLQLMLQARLLSRRTQSNFHLNLLERHQLYASAVVRMEQPDVDSATVVIADDPMGQALAIEVATALADQAQRTGRRLALYLAGTRNDEIRAQLHLRWTALDDLLRLELIRADGAWKAVGLSSEQPPATVTVYIRADSDSATLKSGLHWLNHSIAPLDRVVLCMDAETGLSGALTSASGGLSESHQGRIRVYSSIHAVSDPEHIREQTLTERLARALHAVYLNEISAAEGPAQVMNPSQQPWRLLPESLRASNRDQANHVGTKLSEFQYVVVPLRGSGPEFAFSEPQVETLAELEHSRWVGERSRSGLVYGPTRTERTHPDLQPWDDLTDATREKDRVFVRQLPRVLRREGFEIVRLPLAPGYGPVPGGRTLDTPRQGS